MTRSVAMLRCCEERFRHLKAPVREDVHSLPQRNADGEDVIKPMDSMDCSLQSVGVPYDDCRLAVLKPANYTQRLTCMRTAKQ